MPRQKQLISGFIITVTIIIIIIIVIIATIIDEKHLHRVICTRVVLLKEAVWVPGQTCNQCA